MNRSRERLSHGSANALGLPETALGAIFRPDPVVGWQPRSDRASEAISGVIRQAQPRESGTSIASGGYRGTVIGSKNELTDQKTPFPNKVDRSRLERSTTGFSEMTG